MMRPSPRSTGVLCYVSTAVLTLFLGQSVFAATPASDVARAKERLSGAYVPFIANSGQSDSEVAYYAATFTGTVFVTKDGRIVYSLPGEKTRVSGGGESKRSGGWSLTETAVGGRLDPRGADRASTGVSYMIGNDPARWRNEVRTYDRVSLGEVWPGISLDLKARGENVEKLFTVAPGADPSRIRMSIAGARLLRTDRDGALTVTTGLGDVTFTPPAAYQEIRGERRLVRVAYEVRGRRYGFRLAKYDHSLPVVIDPLLQSTYLGGTNSEIFYHLALAIHPASGDVYLAGDTSSTDFPGTTGGAQPASGGNTDAFVARFNADLTVLKQATYLGGAGPEVGTALAIDPTSGNVFVAGSTASSNFPGTAGGAQPASAGGIDEFVALLNPQLTTLVQATYLGGSGQENFYNLAIAVHPASGDLYLAGGTASTDFPGTAGGAQAANAGGVDGFAAHLNASLTTLIQATYLGGTGEDLAVALAIHPASGDVYVSGKTSSTDFPATAGGAQPTYGGGSYDVFVARLSSSLTTLTQATYFGGSDEDFHFDYSMGLAIQSTSGDVYATGQTFSTDLPGTAGGAQAASGGVPDAFVARWNAGLTTLGQATYLGGSARDYGLALALHPTSGEVYVVGATASPNFPGTAGGAQATYGGGDFDVFIARLNAGLTVLNQSTYLGGSDKELYYVAAIAFHPTSGQVYVGGATDSTNFPGTAGGAQAVIAGPQDAFISRLTADLLAGRTMTALSPAKVWIGVKNSDDVGLKLDLLAEIFANTSKVGQGQLSNVSSGGAGFSGALLDTIVLGLTGGPVALNPGATLKLKISARRTCSGAGHNSGTARLWYNGQPVDSGNFRDAGTRFDATIDGSTNNYYARAGSQLSTTAGSSKLSTDKFVDSTSPCPARPFAEVGSWTITLP
jgi:hypothetical protein